MDLIVDMDGVEVKVMHGAETVLVSRYPVNPRRPGIHLSPSAALELAAALEAQAGHVLRRQVPEGTAPAV